jgi:crossover junction endodeoxyribonuclease RusA
MILAGEPEELARTGIKPAPIELRLPFPPSVNELYFNPKNWRGRASTSEYLDWQDQAGWELKSQRPRKMTARCVITIHLDDKRRGDAANREKAVTDLLVTHGVIKNDSKKYVKGVYTGWEPIEGCRVRIEPA